MKIAKTIKGHLDTISGKRRITILNTFVKENYKEPSHELRNVIGEYSPKTIIEQLNLIIAYGKTMSANKGKGWSRYYSYNRLQEIEIAFATLASHFEGVNNSTGKAALRNLLISSAESLETIKPLVGPFSDLKFDTAVESITQQLANHLDSLQQVKDTAKEVGKQATSIQKNFDKSEKATQVFENLVKETHSLHRELDTHQIAAKELHDRTKTIAKQVDKLQKKFEEKLDGLDELEHSMKEMRARIESEYNSTIEKSKEFEIVAVRMEQTQEQAKNILNQARHALNVSQGSGFLESYKELYENSARLRETFPWTLGAILGFVLSTASIGYNAISLRALQEINALSIISDPVLLGELSLVPVGLFTFFFCLLQLRKKSKIKKRYHTRFAALETYLKLSEHLPYDSPEQMRTASQIMRYLEEDFNPIAIRAMFNANNQFNNSIPIQ